MSFDQGIQSKGPNDPMYNKINNTLKLYEKDVSIFKELLQNADDAKAKSFKFILDETQYPTDSLFDKRLAELQSTSIMVYNSGIFTERDWESLMNFADSNKQKDITSTGTFGLGFSSNYHITDSPTILSGNKIAILDILKSYVDSEETKPGRMLEYTKLESRSKFKDQFLPFDIFGCDIFNENFKYYNGTLMRLPFRKRISDIKGHIFTPEEILKLIDDFTKEVNEFLLFLKHVLDIEVWHFKKDKTKELLFSCKREEIGNDNYMNHVNLVLRNEYIKSNEYSFHMKFTTKYKTQVKQEEWIITTVIGREDSKELLKEIEEKEIKGKFLPITQVAYCLDTEKKITAKAYCFLPLPCLTHLPYQINAYFSLTSDRRGLFNGEKEDVRVKWNETILGKVLVKSSLNLLELRKNEKDFYNTFPRVESFGTEFSRLSKSLYKAIYKTKLFRNTINELISLKESYYLEESNFTPILKRFLENENYSIMMNIPKHVLDSFHAAEVNINKVTPKFLRSVLKTKRKINENDLYVLLEFICQDEDFEDFIGVYAIYNTQGNIQKFDKHGSEDTFYLPSDFEKEIFGQKNNFIINHPKNLNLIYQNIIHSGKLNIETLNSKNFIKILKSIINEPHLREIPWDKTKFSEEWIKLLWKRLAQGDIPLEEIETPIVPTTKETLFIPKIHILHPYDEMLSKDLIEIIHLLDLRFIQPNMIQNETYSHFREKKDIFSSFLKHLGDKHIRPKSHDYYKGKERDFLKFIQNNINISPMENPDYDNLRNLNIYPTYGSTFVNLHPMTKVFYINFSINQGIFGKSTEFLNLDSKFLKDLKCHKNKEMTKEAFYKDYLFGKLFSTDIKSDSNSLETYLRIIIKTLKEDEKDLKKVKGLQSEISNIKFIPAGKEFLSPKELYDPRNSDLKIIFSDMNVFPTSKVVLENLEVFSKYGMKMKLDPSLFIEIISREKKMISESSTYVKLLEFFSDNFDEFEWSNIINEVKKYKWIPIDGKFVSPSIIVNQTDLQFVDTPFPVCNFKLPSKVTKKLFDVESNTEYLKCITDTCLRYVASGQFDEKKYLLYFEKYNEVYEKGLLRDISKNLQNEFCIWMGTHYLSPFFIRSFPGSAFVIPEKFKHLKVLQKDISTSTQKNELLKIYSTITSMNISHSEKRKYLIPFLKNYCHLIKDDDILYPTNSGRFLPIKNLVFSEKIKEYNSFEFIDSELNNIARMIDVPSFSTILLKRKKQDEQIIEKKKKNWIYKSLQFKVLHLMDIKRASSCYVHQQDDYDYYCFNTTIDSSDIQAIFSSLSDHLIRDEENLHIFSKRTLYIFDGSKIEIYDLRDNEVFEFAKENFQILKQELDFDTVIRLNKERDNDFQSQKVFLHFSRCIHKIKYSDKKIFECENSDTIKAANNYFLQMIDSNEAEKKSFIGYKTIHIVIEGKKKSYQVLNSEIISLKKQYNESKMLWEKIGFCQIVISDLIDVKQPFTFNYNASFSSIDWKAKNIGTGSDINHNLSIIELLSEAYLNIISEKEFSKILLIRDPERISESYLQKFYQILSNSLKEYLIVKDDGTDFSDLQELGLKILKTDKVLSSVQDHKIALNSFKSKIQNIVISKDKVIIIWILFLQCKVSLDGLPVYDANGKFKRYQDGKFLLFNHEKDVDLNGYIIDKDISSWIEKVDKAKSIQPYSYEKALEIYINDMSGKESLDSIWNKIFSRPNVLKKKEILNSSIIETNRGLKKVNETNKIHKIHSNELKSLLEPTGIWILKEPKDLKLIPHDPTKLLTELKFILIQYLWNIDRSFLLKLLVKKEIHNLSPDLCSLIGDLPLFSTGKEYLPLTQMDALISPQYKDIISKLPKKMNCLLFDNDYHLIYEEFNIKLIESKKDYIDLIIRNFNQIDDKTFQVSFLLENQEAMINYVDEIGSFKIFGKGYKIPSQCYDPNNVYFQKLDPDNVIQKEFHSKFWISLLKEVGLQTDLTYEVFIEFTKHESSSKNARNLLEILNDHPKWNNNYVQNIKFIPIDGNHFSLKEFYHPKYKDLTHYVCSNYEIFKGVESLINPNNQPSIADVKEYFNILKQESSLEIQSKILKIYDYFDDRNVQFKPDEKIIFKKGFFLAPNQVFFNLTEDYPNYFYSMNEKVLEPYYKLFTKWGVKNSPSKDYLTKIYTNPKQDLSPSEAIGFVACIKLLHEVEPTFEFKILVSNQNQMISKSQICYVDDISLLKYIDETKFRFIHPNLIDLVRVLKVKPLSSLVKMSKTLQQGIETNETKELKSIIQKKEFLDSLFSMAISRDINDNEKMNLTEKIKKIQKMKVLAFDQLQVDIHLDSKEPILKNHNKKYESECLILNEQILCLKKSLFSSRNKNLLIAKEINRYLGFIIKDSLFIIVLLESMKQQEELSEILSTFKLNKVISNDYQEIKRPLGGNILKEDIKLIKNVKDPDELQSNEFIVYKEHDYYYYGEIQTRYLNQFTILKSKNEKIDVKYDSIYKFESFKENLEFQESFTVSKPFQWEREKEFVTLSPNSEEYIWICQNFKISYPKSIIKIQNEKLWGKFNLECKKLYIKNQNSSFKYLCHIPLVNSDYSIEYILENGFDLRISDVSHYGKGIVLSENFKNNSKGNFFICYADVGECYLTESPNSSLTIPPEKGKHGTFENERFDTVKDKYDTFIIYDERRVYPLYFVKF